MIHDYQTKPQKIRAVKYTGSVGSIFAIRKLLDDQTAWTRDRGKFYLKCPDNEGLIPYHSKLVPEGHYVCVYEDDTYDVVDPEVFKMTYEKI